MTTDEDWYRLWDARAAAQADELMGDLQVRASSDQVGLRRESSIDAAALPLWLARLHQALPVDALCRISIDGALPVDRDSLLEGAGFESRSSADYVRLESLPDVVGPGMRYLVCGLNPSRHAAAQGVGFVTASNRFWPAAMAAGIVTGDRRPYDALTIDSVGFTDLVKRATPRADAITKSEFRAGVSRLERLADWLRPKTIIMVGLGGWRAAGFRDAEVGWQPERLGDSPVFLMPNTSGLNTHATLENLTELLVEASTGPPD